MSECLEERLGDEGVPYGTLGSLAGIPKVEPVPEADAPTHEEARESWQFTAADAILEEKAPFFYGIRGFTSTNSYRFHMLNRAMSSVRRQNPPGRDWRNTFDSIKSYARGEEYQHAPISFVNNEGERRRIRAGKAMEEPFMRAKVLEQVREQLHREGLGEDPAFHIYNYLKQWPGRQDRRLSETELNSANRALEVFLFSVHGRSIVLEINRLLNPERASTEATPVE